MPGNAGVALFSRVLDFQPSDVGRLQQHLAASAIDLAIVGPDELIAEGIGDHLRRASIAVVAPSKEAAKIEWSKTFAKELMTEAGIPSPRWETFTTSEAARNALERNLWNAPLVVKADGLAAGKGVTICRTLGYSPKFIEPMLSDATSGFSCNAGCRRSSMARPSSRSRPRATTSDSATPTSDRTPAGWVHRRRPPCCPMRTRSASPTK